MNVKKLFLGLVLLSLVPLAIVAKDKYLSTDEYDSVVISFVKGNHQLTYSDVETLRAVVQKALEKGNVTKIEIAAWSDQEHRVTGNLSRPSRVLADKRIQAIKEVLRKDIGGMKRIATYNMAENASWIGKFFNSSEAELDAVFAKKEAGAMERQDFAIIKRDGAPSKAIVILKVHIK